MKVGDEVMQKYNVYACAHEQIGTIKSFKDGHVYVVFAWDIEDDTGWPYMMDELEVVHEI